MRHFRSVSVCHRFVILMTLLLIAPAMAAGQIILPVSSEPHALSLEVIRVVTREDSNPAEQFVLTITNTGTHNVRIPANVDLLWTISLCRKQGGGPDETLHWHDTGHEVTLLHPNEKRTVMAEW